MQDCVCSTLFSVQMGDNILTFSPKISSFTFHLKSRILSCQILDICGVLYVTDGNAK